MTHKGFGDLLTTLRIRTRFSSSSHSTSSDNSSGHPEFVVGFLKIGGRHELKAFEYLFVCVF